MFRRILTHSTLALTVVSAVVLSPSVGNAHTSFSLSFGTPGPRYAYGPAYRHVYYRPGYYHPGWHNGYWSHVYHGGRFGWWWVSGPRWYYYAQPVYPYPVVESQTVVVEPAPQVVQPAPPPPPVVISNPSTGPIQSLSAAQPPPMYYYCSSPAGYYPNVASCPTGWKTVPATPPQ